MVDHKRNFIGIRVCDAVADLLILSGVRVLCIYPGHSCPPRLIFIKVDGLLISRELRLVVVDICDENTNPGGGLFPHACIGLVKGGHGQRVPGLLLRIEGRGNVEHPRDRVDPELSISVAGDDAEPHLRVPAGVQVPRLGRDIP